MLSVGVTQVSHPMVAQTNLFAWLDEGWSELVAVYVFVSRICLSGAVFFQLV